MFAKEKTGLLRLHQTHLLSTISMIQFELWDIYTIHNPCKLLNDTFDIDSVLLWSENISPGLKKNHTGYVYR